MSHRPGMAETKDIIIMAAFKVFGQKGFGSTTIKDIANEAGVAAGSIYNYFPDKEELFRETVMAGWTETINKFKEINASAQKFELKFEQFLDFSFDLLEAAHPLLSGMLFGANQRQLVQENVDKLIDYFEEWLLQGEKEGLLKLQVEGKFRRMNIRLMIMGVMLQISLTPASELKSALNSIKQGIYQFVNFRKKDN